MGLGCGSSSPEEEVVGEPEPGSGVRLWVVGGRREWGFLVAEEVVVGGGFRCCCHGSNEGGGGRHAHSGECREEECGKKKKRFTRICSVGKKKRFSGKKNRRKW